MSTLFNLLAVVSLVLMLAALWRPRLSPLKNPTKLKNTGLYLALFVFFYVLSGTLAPHDAGDSAPAAGASRPAAPAGSVLAWKELSRNTVAVTATGRDRLMVSIVPDEDQSGARQQNLLATAMGVAVKMQRECGTPVVVVNFLAARAENHFGEPLLAHVIYIPDGKGFDGTQKNAPEWETLRAAKRGFTPKELEYLALWAAKYQEYRSRSGLREKELDADISKAMGIRPGSLNPFDNSLEDAASSHRAN